MQLSVYLPEGLEPFKDDLEFFVSIMVRKLHTNRHKGTEHTSDPSKLVAKVQEELDEVWKAMSEEGQFEAAVECADVANFAFLAARSVLNMTREEFDKLTEDKEAQDGRS